MLAAVGGFRYRDLSGFARIYMMRPYDAFSFSRGYIPAYHCGQFVLYSTAS
jgi:hypothetical protein